MTSAASARNIVVRDRNGSAASADTYRTTTATPRIERPSVWLALAAGSSPRRHARTKATGTGRSPCPASGSFHQVDTVFANGCANRTAKARAVAASATLARTARGNPIGFNRAVAELI